MLCIGYYFIQYTQHRSLEKGYMNRVADLVGEQLRYSVAASLLLVIGDTCLFSNQSSFYFYYLLRPLVRRVSSIKTSVHVTIPENQSRYSYFL